MDRKPESLTVEKLNLKKDLSISITSIFGLANFYY